MDKLDWFVKVLTATSPPREGEPVGTADMSRLDYSRWQYDADTEKERPTRPGLITADGSMMLTLKRRGQHSRLVLC